MAEKQGYLDFDEYIRQGEPDQKEKASIWQTAIGLQAVDGLTTSEYLKQTISRSQNTSPMMTTNKKPTRLQQTSPRFFLLRHLISAFNLICPTRHDLYLNPAITAGYVRMLYPQSPRHPRQKYLLTVKGIALYKELIR